MKLNKRWIIGNLFLVSAFSFFLWLVWAISQRLQNLSSETLTGGLAVQFILSLICLLIGSLFVLEFFKGDMFYEYDQIQIPNDDFEIKEYKNMTIIAYKDYAREFACRKDMSKNVKLVKMIYYYDIKKSKIRERIISYK